MTEIIRHFFTFSSTYVAEGGETVEEISENFFLDHSSKEWIKS